jgi:hypothetical protein
MTAMEFVKWAEGYYGIYPQGQKKDIWEYLIKCSKDYLDALKAALLINYSCKWGRPPDIAIFEECRDSAENSIMYRQYLPEPEGEIISPDEAKKFFEAFSRIVNTKEAWK